MKKRIYLDHAASTPICSEAFEAMEPFLKENYGNPSALYHEGVFVKRAIDDARNMIASIIKSHKNEIVFTSGGTEADNLALRGVINAFKVKNPGVIPQVIISAIEHPAIYDAAIKMRDRGDIKLAIISVDSSGIIKLDDLKKSITETTVLVSIMYANNEIGTIQPIADVVRIVRSFKKVHGISKMGYPYVHTDACQAVNYLDSNTLLLGVDLMTINASKIYGPKGVGALFIKEGVEILPIILGGSQEGGMRAGTENTAGIVGFATAMQIANSMKERESQRLVEIRDYFIEELKKEVEGIKVNGGMAERLPNNVHVSLSGLETDIMVIEMDALGVACSSRSACKSKKDGASHVIIALPDTNSEDTHLRFSLGRSTTKEDIDVTIKNLVTIINKYK